ncbi:MauE/DoxX family redox-associated membrane protein [Pseudonocardia sp. CA-107938]|uniref:MauE/DoxX family redox-associated membrane protein n=1 Tax=Pseudonocardia sp. CA-107938 TaxID=3240021 RepID=UPI003D934150
MTELVGAIGVGCCWLVAVVFAISATGKLRTAAVRAAFRRSVAGMAVLPAGVVGPVAAAVPVLEALAAVLLVVPPTAVLGCGLALVLVGAFSTGIVIVLRRGTKAACLCFGTTERPYRAAHLVRNGLLAAAALAGAVLSGYPVDLLAALIMVVGGVLVALVLVAFDDLLDLFGAPVES